MSTTRSARMRGGFSATALALGALLAVALAAPSIADAHVPFIASGQRTDRIGTAAVPYPQAETIPPPNVSRAVYGYLSADAAYDVYTFTVPATMTVDIALIVPVRVGLETFRPTLRVYAENSGVELAGVDSGKSPRPSFWEPFSAASFWEGPTISAYLRPDERYYAIVYPPPIGKRSGAYVLTFSGPEKFTTAEWFRAAGALPTIWLGSWAGGPARPGVYVCGVLSVVLAIVVVWLWLRRRRRRRRQLEVAHAARQAPAAPEDATADAPESGPSGGTEP